MGLSQEQIEQAMEQYGNLRHQLELLRANRQTTFDKILEKYPDVLLEIEQAREELDIQIEQAEKTEEQCKKTLQAMLNQFSENAPIKDKLILQTPLLRVSLTKQVQYDSSALDGRATVDPTLLAFRSEKITTRISLNKL